MEVREAGMGDGARRTGTRLTPRGRAVTGDRMRTPSKVLGIGVPLLAAVLLASVGPVAADEPPTYERDVKPLLARRCAVCHNAKKVGNRDLSGGLALDTFEAILRGTEEHKVVVPGQAGESELYR